PNQLSGGQRQRVAFARALAPHPQVLLLDEPFAAIDAKVRQELRNWLKETLHRVGITSIFVTHDQDEAVEVADEIIITNHGRIEQVGTPLDIYSKPKTPFVAEFIGTPVVIDNCSVLTGFVDVNGPKRAIIRPEFLKIYKQGTMKRYGSAAEDGVVEAVVFRGSRLDVTLRVKDYVIHGEYAFDAPTLTVGEKVKVLIYRLHVLDGEQTYLRENSAMMGSDVFYI
ncbi:MAG: ATP-binding cassette domain-containing protein, partial [Megasphaera sp.]|nr:ATP-binding cassette domain-containing protein [Megasphaera sp.]